MSRVCGSAPEVSSTALPRVVPFGERALLVELGTTIEPALNAQVHALALRLDHLRGERRGLGRCVPAYASLLGPFDDTVIQADELATELLSMARAVAAGPSDAPVRLVRIPVRYGGEQGPDLAEVARRTGHTVDQVIEIHSGSTYHVYMLGFAPGFAYLGSLAQALRIPRRDEPRLRVPAGSVAIASSQTAIYPHATAGGWHLLGHSDVILWDSTAASPSLLAPGDRVRFEPI
jgi:KipI family sensor histidine kinase inhibitor